MKDLESLSPSWSAVRTFKVIFMCKHSAFALLSHILFLNLGDLECMRP